MPTSPRQAPVSGGVCALHPPHRHERPSHTPPSAPPIHPSSTAGPRHLPRACLGRSNPHRRISLRFRPTRFLSTVAAVVSGPHPSARAPRRHTKNALRLRHTGKSAARARRRVSYPVSDSMSCRRRLRSPGAPTAAPAAEPDSLRPARRVSRRPPMRQFRRHRTHLVGGCRTVCVVAASMKVVPHATFAFAI